MMAIAPNVIERGDGPIFMLIEDKKVYEEVAERIRRLIHRQRLQLLRRLTTERSLTEQFFVNRKVVWTLEWAGGGTHSYR